MKQYTRPRNWYLLLAPFVLFALFTTSCSSPSESKFEPKIIDKDSLLTPSLKRIFYNTDYPAGLIPVMVLENSIDEPIKTSARADDVFDELSNELESDNYEDFGLLVYITKEPRLMQLRLGDHYSTFGNLCGITSGQDYLQLQLQFTEDKKDAALTEMLNRACQNIVERNNLSWWQRGQLSGVALAINNVIDWFGSPSKNFYGTLVAKPVYMCISYGNKYLGSWIWGIALVFVLIFCIRWITTRILKIIIPSIKTRNFLTWFFNIIISGLYSFSAAGCAMYFSSGRLEDLYAIKAYGIPNVESFITDPSMFVHENNFWIAGLFIFLIMLSICMNTLCSDMVLFSTFPIDKQMAQWNSLDKTQQGVILGLNQATEIKPGQTPYQAVADKKIEKLGDVMGTYLTGLSIGAVFFFPKAVLWTGIVYSIAKIIPKYKRIKILLKARFSKNETGAGLLGGMVVLVLIVTVISMGVDWFIDPFDRKVETVVEQPLAPVYKKVKVTAKTANLRTGPGTDYEFATNNNEKWQVDKGTELDVIGEENGWYQVRIGDNPQEVYVKQSLCKDDINVGLYGSLPFGKSQYKGTMDGFPIELTITKSKKTGDLSGTYKNVKFKTVMKLWGETSAEQMGNITLHGTDNKKDWHFSLTGQKEHITGIAADDDNLELPIELYPR